MPAPITAAYAAVLAILIVVLGINVTMHRVKLQVPLGDGGNAQMLRIIRLHGNAAEYIPLAVALMLIMISVNGGCTLCCMPPASLWSLAACCKLGECGRQNVPD